MISDYHTRMLQFSSKSFPEDFELEDGNTFCACRICQFEFIGLKGRTVCKECEVKNEIK